MGGMVRIPGSKRRVTRWSGGTSSEICIWPETADYGKRNFQFRVSTATADTDEVSPYTALPGVKRHLLMLAGTARVVHEGRYALDMTPYREIDCFDGGWETYAKGKVRDFNLMTRDGCAGSLSVLETGQTVSFDGDVSHVLLFCGEGWAEVTVPEDGTDSGGQASLFAEDALLLFSPRTLTVSFSENGRAVLVIVRKA